MTDKEMIYNFLDKAYKIGIDDKYMCYMVVDKYWDTKYSFNGFKSIFLKTFSDFTTSEGTSYEIMLEWYRERLNMIDKRHIELPFLNKDRFSQLLTHKTSKKVR